VNRPWASRPNGLTVPFHNCDWINYELDCVKFWPLITLDAIVSPYTKDSIGWSCTWTYVANPNESSSSATPGTFVHTAICWERFERPASAAIVSAANDRQCRNCFGSKRSSGGMIFPKDQFPKVFLKIIYIYSNVYKIYYYTIRRSILP
jgi:hypothetical protein